MKAEIKKKLQFLIELGLNQNEINEILDAQEILNQSQEFKKEEVLEDEQDLFFIIRGYNEMKEDLGPLFLCTKI